MVGSATAFTRPVLQGAFGVEHLAGEQQFARGHRVHPVEHRHR